MLTFAIDTAGIRRKKKLADSIEFYSDARSHRTIRRADVVVLLFDAMVELGAIEKHLGRYIADHYRPVVLAANKCDLLDPSLRPKLARYVHRELAGLSHAPIAFLSAQRGEGVWELLAMAHSLHRASMRRIGTGELNRALERIAERRPPSSKAQQARILYATQVKTSPPTFVLFVNSKYRDRLTTSPVSPGTLSPVEAYVEIERGDKPRE